MRYLAMCFAVSAVVFQATDSMAAEAAKESSYTFTINGFPFVPRCFSLRGDPDHPSPGDVIAVGPLLLTLGPERNCQFVISCESKFGLDISKVSLRLADGRLQVVGVRVFAESQEDKDILIDPLQKMSADEIHELWGIYLGAWPEEVAQKLRHVDSSRICIVLAGNATVQRDGRKTLPPLPSDIRYLSEESLDHIENFEPLRQWTQLRFLRIDGNEDGVFDAQWLSKNSELRHLDVLAGTIEHPEALSQLERLESLDLSHISNLATIEFVEKQPHLRCLNLRDTAVWDLSPLNKHDNLVMLDASYTKVRDLEGLEAKNLEELDISETMVRNLSPLSKLKKLTKVTATNSTVEKLPNRPMPALRCLTIYSTPLLPGEIEAFAKHNPKCEIMVRWTDALYSATAGATRLRIRCGGPGFGSHYELGSFLHLRNTLLDISDPAQIREFVRLIEIDEKNSDEGCWDGCCLEHGPTFEFYRGNNLFTVVGWVIGQKPGLCWAKNWPKLNARLTSQSRDRLTKWLLEHGYRDLYDDIKMYLTAEKKAVEQHSAIVNCYPERARVFFAKPTDEENDVDEENSDDEDGEFTQSAKIAKAVGDPVELAVFTCRAVGSLDAGDSLKKGEPQIVVEAGRKIQDQDYLKALEKIRGDRQAELGAARLYFRDTGYQCKIPRAQQRDWMLRFAVILLNHNEGENLLEEFIDENYAEPEVVAFLRKVSRGEFGRNVAPINDKASIRTRTYLALADHGISGLQQEIEALLAKTTRKPDVAALEIALALLGDPKHLKPEHLKPDSPDARAALRAIEKFDGREGMDILVEAGLDNSDRFIQNESLLLFQKITDQAWIDVRLWGDEEPRLFVGHAKKWWREHRDEFLASRRAEKKTQPSPCSLPSSK